MIAPNFSDDAILQGANSVPGLNLIKSQCENRRNFSFLFLFFFSFPIFFFFYENVLWTLRNQYSSYDFWESEITLNDLIFVLRLLYQFDYSISILFLVILLKKLNRSEINFFLL